MLNSILNLLFPPRCIFCGKLLKYDSIMHICSICYPSIPFIKHKLAKSDKFEYFDDVICVSEYSGIIKKSLIGYKFYNKPSYYMTFSQMLANKVKEVTNYKSFDMIISVPLHKRKENFRGYNQNLLISKALAKELKVREGSKYLSRVKNTSPQRQLDKAARYENIKDAFKVTDNKLIRGKTILLVDDILTTGSTLNECSRVLKQAGANKVIAAVIASGRKY